MSRTGRPRKSLDITRKCPTCGAKFTVPDWSRQKYCSYKCSRYYRRTLQHELTCAFCGERFLAVQSNTRFCSERCTNAQRRKDRPEIHRNAIRRWAEKNPERERERRVVWMRNKRNALRREFWEMQGGRCYLCGDELPPLDSKIPPFIEHDHACCTTRLGCPICRRGICCATCNRLIGMANDDPERLRRIADNLKRAKALVRDRLAEAEGALFWIA